MPFPLVLLVKHTLPGAKAASAGGGGGALFSEAGRHVALYCGNAPLLVQSTLQRRSTSLFWVCRWGRQTMERPRVLRLTFSSGFNKRAVSAPCSV